MKITKESFLSKRKELESKIADLRQEIRNLEKSHIVENKEFTVGDKVEITTPEYKNWSGDTIPESSRFAFISKVFVGYHGDIEYNIHKCKKDGTQSKHSDWLLGSETMKLA